MSSTATTGTAFKVSVPEAFDGTKAKYRAFIIQCYLYMAANTKDINDKAKKISFILSYMKAGTNYDSEGRVYYIQNLASRP
jgi:hypothetical protein